MQTVPKEFLQMVVEDMAKISSVINPDKNKIVKIDISKKESDLLSLHRELDGKYQSCIKGWGDGMYGWFKGHGFSYEYLDEESLEENLKLVYAKLSTYRYQVNAVPNVMPSITQVNVNLDNNINITISFDSVRAQIEEMPSLTGEETNEIIEKVNEIEKVVKSTDSKKKKWAKVNGIIKWVADKSVDVGIALLPLLLKI